MAMQRIYIFERAHESAELTLAQQTERNDNRMPKGKSSDTQRGAVILELGLVACNSDVGTARLRTSP
jgi:hypothetical protein